MPTIRIAVQLHPQHGAMTDLLAAARTADELGADLIYTWDHFHPLYGDPAGRHFECWTTLAAIAAITSRAEIGPLVACNSYRNPDLLADMTRTVDHISGGRCVLGIGSGWFRRDYEEYGYAFGTAGSRADDLERDLPRIMRRLTPPPVRPIPVLIGGTGPKRTLRLVARHADVWHAMFPAHPGELSASLAALASWCEAERRDPASIERAVGIEPDQLSHDLERYAADYVDLGFTQLTLGINGPAYDVGPVRDWLAWRDEVNGRVS
jgi:probable F420-dependent oxidoreductase